MPVPIRESGTPLPCKAGVMCVQSFGLSFKHRDARCLLSCGVSAHSGRHTVRLGLCGNRHDTHTYGPARRRGG
eukprot:377258-Prymnesium_polylepis.1